MARGKVIIKKKKWGIYSFLDKCVLEVYPFTKRGKQAAQFSIDEDDYREFFETIPVELSYKIPKIPKEER